ncbi:hypothetical protein AB0H83_34015 [Dactylosporangium sp. NPDC050688]|uniref:hypothetical protein n=1 Tax=Dactylosporangium sp. NPDC050688 TaxID=3157217 RepID=UPI0034031B8E
MNEESSDSSPRSFGQYATAETGAYQLNNQAKNITFNSYNFAVGTQAEPSEAEQSDEPPAGVEKKVPRWVWVVAVIIAIPLAISSACEEEARKKAEAATFPSISDPLPYGVANSDVFQAMKSALSDCAAAKVAQPTNCPQSVDAPSDEDVTWKVLGDPANGAKVAYKDLILHVLGVAALSATFRSYSGDTSQVVVVRFHAKLNYSDDGIVLKELIAVSKNVGGEVKKSDPGIPADSLKAATLAGLKQCVQSKTAPMPAGCPSIRGGPSGDRATWALATDPIANAKVTFDTTTGLYRVTGSYSLTCSYKDIFGTHKWSGSANYRATIAPVDTSAEFVLAVQE